MGVYSIYLPPSSPLPIPHPGNIKLIRGEGSVHAHTHLQWATGLGRESTRPKEGGTGASTHLQGMLAGSGMPRSFTISRHRKQRPHDPQVNQQLLLPRKTPSNQPACRAARQRATGLGRVSTRPKEGGTGVSTHLQWLLAGSGTSHSVSIRRHSLEAMVKADSPRCCGWSIGRTRV